MIDVHPPSFWRLILRDGAGNFFSMWVIAGILYSIAVILLGPNDLRAPIFFGVMPISALFAIMAILRGKVLRSLHNRGVRTTGKISSISSFGKLGTEVRYGYEYEGKPLKTARLIFSPFPLKPGSVVSVILDPKHASVSDVMDFYFDRPAPAA